MKKNEIDQLKIKSVAEITKRIIELEKERAEGLIQIKMGKVKNVHSPARIKRDIARLKTIEQIKILAQITQKPPVKEQNATN